MSSSLITSTRFRTAFTLISGLLLACSTRPPGGGMPNGSVGGSGNASGNSGSGMNSGLGGGSGSGVGGASAGGGTGGSPFGTGGTMVMENDPSCTAYTAPAAPRFVAPRDPGVDGMLNGLDVNSALLPMLHGGQRLPGNWWEIDFDATGVQSLGLNDMPMRDGPRGVHQLNNNPSTTFAVAEARAASFDLDLEFRVGQVMAAEMKAFRYDVMLGPTINVLRHPGWGRAQETYGEDPVLVGRMGTAYVLGMQGAGMMACPKHFAVNNTENNRGDGADEPVVNMVLDQQTLRENYVRHFEMVVKDADPACIMAAYNRVTVSGFPTAGRRCTQNPDLLTGVLRDDWQWEGFVVSDWWATVANEAAASLNAGLDLEMPDNNAFNQLSNDLTGGRITLDTAKRAAGRIINARLKFGHHTDAYKNAPGNPGIVNDQVHKDLARETAEKGAVLLKNDNILPLGPKAGQIGLGMANVSRIVVLGPDAGRPITETTTIGTPSGLGDRGSSNTVPPYAVSFVDGLRNHPAAAGMTVDASNNAGDAGNYDVAIIPVTMQFEDEGEGFNEGKDRRELGLGGYHPIHWSTKPSAFIAQAAAANPNVIVLLAVGSAVVMEDWIGSAKGIVQTFYPGQEGGNATARLLFGDINFSGKLPFTVAANADHYPVFNNETGGDAPSTTCTATASSRATATRHASGSATA